MRFALDHLPRKILLSSVCRLEQGGSYQFRFGDWDDLSADVHLDPFTASPGAQVDQRGPADLVALLHPDIDLVRVEIAVLDQVGGKATIRASRGRIFHDAVVIGKRTGVNVIGRIDSLATEDEKHFRRAVLDPVEPFVAHDAGASDRLQAPQRQQDERQSG